MTLTIAPSRSARSFPHHIEPRSFTNLHDIPRPHVDNIPTQQGLLYFANAADLRGFRTLLGDCLASESETSRNIAIKVQSFPLINASLLAPGLPLDRIDRAHALIGTGWLNAYSFVQALANQIRRTTIGDADLDQELELVWQQGSILADAAELLARVTKQGPSLHSWLCGWMVAIVEIDARMRLRASAQDGYQVRTAEPPKVIAARLRQTIAFLDSGGRLSIPDIATARPGGPWCVASSAARLIGLQRRLPMLGRSLTEIQPIAWPASLSGGLAKRVAGQMPTSVQFATASWTQVQLARDRIAF